MLGVSDKFEWMIEVLMIMLLTAVLSLLAGWMLRLVSNIMSKTNTRWDDIFVEAARTPLKIIIWIIGTYYAAQSALRESWEEMMSNSDDVRDVAIVVMIAWALVRYVNAGTEHYWQRRKRKGLNYDYTAVNAVGKLLKIAIIISAFLICLQNFGISVDGVLAFGGISGIAVGFAAKDMLANFFGAFIIYFDKPFKVGDWIRSPEKEIEGTVEDIGWRMTTIRTFDQRPLYAPNSIFANIVVENPSRMLHRRIYETIGVRYDDLAQMRSITGAVRDMLKAHEEITQDQTLIVNFNKFNDSSCDFFIYCFTHTTQWVRYHEVKEDILLQIADIVAEHGAEIAFPTRTLHMIPEKGLLDSSDKAAKGESVRQKGKKDGDEGAED
ncbi:MAG: mechanosensitive ion channel protein MscS [Rickettsiales bacterium]|nr:mechanosensitive ion channel protein MscS [Rickettsiales bacterium]